MQLLSSTTTITWKVYCPVHSICRGLLALFTISMLWNIASPIYSHSDAPKEYDLKAVFLYNFTQFIEWPDTAFSNKSDTFIIAIVGNDPFKHALDNTVSNETVNNRPMKVERFDHIDNISKCHILFVSQSESAKIKSILAKPELLGALTVSDIDKFAERGGIIGFFTEDNRIRLKINVDKARESQLSISSKLLRLANIVKTDED